MISFHSPMKLGGGKRVAQYTVGTSTAGWTAADCDYLCDGTDDQVEIIAAIQDLPATGGEVIILAGAYNITSSVTLDKGNTTLTGNGTSTIFKRLWDATGQDGVITVISNGNTVQNLAVDGNKDTFPSYFNCGVLLSRADNNTIAGTLCSSNGIGICDVGGKGNILNSNICNENASGIQGGSNSSIVGNVCNDNTSDGIVLNSGTSKNTIVGNVCNNNRDSGIKTNYINNSNISGNTCSLNNTGIFINGINNTITGNICTQNGYGIRMDGSSTTKTDKANNTVTGNNLTNNKYYGIYLTAVCNNTIVGNNCICGTGLPSDYTSSQYTIYLYGTNNNYNLIADNNIMGKNYITEGGTGNTFTGNKYN